MTNEYAPSSVSAPGESLRLLLQERGMTQSELARRMGRPPKAVSDIVNGNARITEETALELERTLGASAGYWLGRDARYREYLERERLRGELTEQEEWLASFPVAEMAKRGWIERHPATEILAERMLSFFGVASIQVWNQTYSEPLVAFRASPAFEARATAVAAWLRAGELEAAEMDCEPYDEVGFRRTLEEARTLTTTADPAVFLPKLRSLCATAGVAVAVVRTLPGCPISGATRWLGPTRALLVLSGRYRSDDQLWFSFFHEAGHILLHKKRLFLESGRRGERIESKEEHEANQFAANHIIPKSYASKLKALRTERQVVEFARDCGIAPGLVVGRMQHDELIEFYQMSQLKRRYSWADE